MMRAGICRRRVLQASVAAAIGGAVQAPFIRRAQAAANELDIAVINSLSGKMARYGLELKRGIELAAKAAGDSGLEIGGAPISVRIKEYDDKSDAVTAARLVERAIDSDIVIAGVGSVNSKTIIPVAQRQRTPMLALWAQVDGVFAGQKGAPYVFGPMPPFSLYYTKILAMAAELKDPEVRTVAMITPRDELGVFTAEQYVPSDVEKAGLELIGTEFFPPNTQEFGPALDRIRRSDPDILIINCYTPDIIGVYKEMQSIGYFPPVVIVEAPTNLPESLGSSLDGVLVPSFWDPTLDATSDPIIGTSRDFAERYKEAYGESPPDFVAANGANSIVVAVMALVEAAGGGDSEKLREVLMNMDTETFFSTLRFADDGLNQGGVVYPSQFQDGVARLVYPPELKTAELIHPLPAHLAQ